LEALAATRPHPMFVNVLLDVIRKCPPTDTHLRHAARIALRNCLENFDTGDWKDLPAGSTPIVDDVAPGVATRHAAFYLAEALKAGRIAPDRLPGVAERIGQHGFRPARQVVVGVVKDQADRALALAMLRGFIRGSRAGRTDLAHEEAVVIFAWVRA